MTFQKFGKLIFPVVATACSLDVLSSAFQDPYYDITYQVSGDLDKAGFPYNVKNMCSSEISTISARNMLFSHEYMDYFVDGTLDLRGSGYFPTRGCEDDDSLERKEKEAKAYLDKNFEPLEKDYREHLEKAKKYLLSEDSYEIKNASAPIIGYEHEIYEKTGRINIKLDMLIDSFSIEEASGKQFKQLQFYIEPSRKQVDLIAKAREVVGSIYALRMNVNLDSMKTFMHAGCNHSAQFIRSQLVTISSDSSCIATKLTNAEINIIMFDGTPNERDSLFTEDRDKRWILVDTIPVKWE